MRKALFTTALVLMGLVPLKSQLTSTENYVSSTTCLDAACVKKAWSVQYFDGLGRPKQVVGVKASPAGKDIVTPIVYDGFGRQTDSWLPTPMPSKSGGIQGSVEAAATTFYSDIRPFSHQELEKSPLDRIEQQIQPGAAWQQNPVSFDYQANDAGDQVHKFITVTSWTDGATHAVLTKGSYAAGTLYKNTVSDEDGNTTTEFKNGRGQTLLVRKNDGSNDLDTYYVYNEYDQLAFVIPPLAANQAISPSLLDDLCYQYRYDGRGRLVEKKLPGKGWEHMVYDKQDRLVLMQDAKLKTINNFFRSQGWLFTKYDLFGRVVYTGFFKNTGSRSSMQTALNNMQANAANNEARTASPTFTSQGMAVYYDNKAFPTGAKILLSVNYYDSYPVDMPAKPTQIFTKPVLTDDSQSSTSTKSMAVASYIKNIEDDRWTRNYNWYDQRGRHIATHSYNHLGGYTKTESDLDFAGMVQRTYTYHKRLRTDAEIQIRERFEYNPNSLALEKHYHEVVNHSPEELLAENSYDEIGRLTNKKVGGNLQSIDYAYNIRGWMTGINLDAGGNFQGGKLFNYKINYNDSNLLGSQTPNNDYGQLQVKPRFNGNIAEVQWNSGSGNKVYGYVYDGVNRLLAGLYQEPGTPDLKINSEIISYDLNGNIDKLKRSGYFSTTSALLIDDLQYTYQGNRLTSIADTSLDPSGYEGGGAAISYDDNGNMTDMQDKGISKIAYNHLNLPAQIDIQTDSQASTVIKTAYRADGSKIRKENTTVLTGIAGTTTAIGTTDYIDGFQYSGTRTLGNMPPPEEAADLLETAVALEREAFAVVQKPPVLPPVGPAEPGAGMALQFMPTAEGFYDFTEKKYIYQYKDHLGNVRLSYARNQNGSTDVLDRNDYYPFGMNHLNPLDRESFFGQSSYKNYKYNGKELQETGMYAMDFRHYMPDVGRFTGIDRLSEILPTLTPYRFAFNNPISFADPTGLFETRRAAREYRREHEITGSITRNKDGSYSINDKQNGVSYTRGTEGSQENFMGDGVQESVLLTAKAKSQTTETPNWYTPGGQANWFFAAGSTIAGIRGMQNSERMYGEGIRRGLNGNYQLTGRNLNLFRNAPMTKTTTPISQVGKWGGIASKASFGVGVTMDAVGVWNYTQNPNSPNAVHPAKAGLNTTMGAVGVWGGPPGAVVSAAYFGIDAFYPGGWEGALQDQGNLINANQEVVPNFNLYKDVPGGF